VGFSNAKYINRVYSSINRKFIKYIDNATSVGNDTTKSYAVFLNVSGLTRCEKMAHQDQELQ